jgi:hypothetical protein
MPTDRFNFDVRDSDLRIGIEVEYPKQNRSDERYKNRGGSSGSIRREIRDGDLPVNARGVHDGTVGLEVINPDPMQLEDATSWYYDVVESVEAYSGDPMQPTGLMKDGNTAGLHLHISELSSEEAHELYDLSTTPWAKILFCTSIATDGDGVSWPVFRGGRYCRMNTSNFSDRYNCVNDRGGGHYEWRMPEPMDPDHFEIVVRFLSLFKQESELAYEYAQELLDDADERITAIKRAEAVGMDIDNMPVIERAPCPDDPEQFYEAVASEWSLPEIHYVSFNDGNFYIFESEFDATFEAAGVEFHPEEVLYADTLESVSDPQLCDDVRRAYERHGDEERRATEATDELKKIVKKKKSKI